jgi:hypothetical protein
MLVKLCGAGVYENPWGGRIFGQNQFLILEVLTALKMSVLVFCVVMPCGLVGRYSHFRGT